MNTLTELVLGMGLTPDQKYNILTVLYPSISLFPLVAIIHLIFLESFQEQRILLTALHYSFNIFLLACVLTRCFDETNTESYLLILKYDFISLFNNTYTVGFDGITYLMILLSTFFIPICFACSWYSITFRVKEFSICLLVIDFLLVQVFSTANLLFFYICFEAVLIPMFLIIGIWGSRTRRGFAAYSFFLYTLIGSLPLLVVLLYLHDTYNTLDLIYLLSINFIEDEQLLLFFGFLIALAVKIPLFPLHGWLPEAHTEAPTAGSVLLAGILLKLGGYGFIRFAFPLFPFGISYFKPLVYTLCILGIVYISCVTLVQIDLKKLIAYSSIIHMSYVILGLFSETHEGIAGAIYLMLGHGFVSGGLFLCIGVLYDRYTTRLIASYSGLTQIMPLFGSFFSVFLLANTSLPGTSNFAGEILILTGLIQTSKFISILSLIGLFFNSIYNILLFSKIIFGKVDGKKIFWYSDMDPREFITLLIVFTLVILMGAATTIFEAFIDQTVNNLIKLIISRK